MKLSHATPLGITAALALTIGLTGCGSGGSTAAAPGSSMSMSGATTTDTSTGAPASTSMSGMAGPAMHNDHDTNFVADMISHHEQAVQLARLAPGRAGVKVAALAARIKAAQGPEVTTMKGWLTTWGLPMPDDMSGMDMSGSMPGMASIAQVAKLKTLKGAGFDKLFLTLMIGHHRGAVTMARAEIATGSTVEVTTFAKKVIADQTKEIAVMQGLLA